MNVDDIESAVTDLSEQRVERGLILDDCLKDRVCRHVDIRAQ
ncbi:MAG TPA: hypothetical protein VIT64_06290 [Ilumatobacteraceae bacterium]